MSSDKKGAVALLNKKVIGNSLRIGCGLHIIQIIMNHFEQEAFVTLANTARFQENRICTTCYIWLENYMMVTIRDKPLNINSQIIRNLYDGLLGFHYYQYQLPLRIRWGYELRTAKQYVDRRIAHIEFTNWFINEMEKHNTPKQYFNDWCLFRSWLLDPKLNIHFIIGQDKVPRIYENNQLINLPLGNRTHEMPDKVYEWYEFLQELRLSSSQIDKENLLERLKKMQTNQQKTPLQELNLQQFGPEVVSNIFNNLLN
ncbi:46153_t:CDS:2 [Gigaspora margarita]|uniref:46153_t:CDS:1 n=1 Tax=Gigaspora margarita TaxID=4874 RepID=A0ABN7V4N4_GIGMA|nr:46153_t:CDS:2 [Gigaspora margarita]